MTTDHEGADQSRWIVEPPQANEVQLYIAVGDGVQVTDEVRVALEQLLNSFQSEEVEGYGKCFPKCPDLLACGTYYCSGLNNCSVLGKYPCLAETRCQITRIY